MTSVIETLSQRAVRWYPPSYDIRIETIPIPEIEHPDDAIVKIQLAGLCGSDLHVYRGTERLTEP
jgi:threonine dehydrogenase-like Zn-dependent dehydrogenase